MFYETIMIGLALLCAGCVIALFLCRIEATPRLVKDAVEAARFKLNEEAVKRVRFW